MGTIIFLTITMVGTLLIIYRALNHAGMGRLLLPLVLIMLAISLLSVSMYLSPTAANILRTVIGLVLIAWVIYSGIVSQIAPSKEYASNLGNNLNKEHKEMIEKLAQEVMDASDSDFEKELEGGLEEDKDNPDFNSSVPLPAGTSVTTSEGEGTIDIYIPTLEMVYKTEEYRDVQGYRVRMDDNNIRYFKMSDVQELLK